MNGEINLENLLKNINPVIDEKIYVFISLAMDKTLTECSPILTFQEEEGTTYIIEKIEAEKLGINYSYPSKKITLNVHSSLNAVGFLAVITDRLKKQGISVNVVSGFYHDHLFIDIDKMHHAMGVLGNLQKGL